MSMTVNEYLKTVDEFTMIKIIDKTDIRKILLEHPARRMIKTIKQYNFDELGNSEIQSIINKNKYEVSIIA